LKHDPFEDGTLAVTVHRLVQAGARVRSEENGSAQEGIERLMARLGAIYPDLRDVPSWPLCAQLTPHLLALHTASHHVSALLNWSELLSRAARYFHKRAVYSKAMELFSQALATRERMLGAEHPDTATNFSDLASVLRDLGDYSGARPLYGRTLAIREKLLGPQHPETAQSLDDLGCLMMQQSDFAGAEPLFERALAIRETVLGPQHYETGWSLLTLASVLAKKGDLAAA